MEETMKIRKNTEELIYNKKKYEIVMTEEKTLFDAFSLGLLPKERKNETVIIRGTYQIEEFVLYLKEFTVCYPGTNEIVKKENLQIPLSYCGGLVIVDDMLEEYKDYSPLYGYQELLELIFEDGQLVMTANHSRAMYRVRRTLESGLKDMSNYQDAKRIERFVRHQFVQKYEETLRIRHYAVLKRYVKNGISKLFST